MRVAQGRPDGASGTGNGYWVVGEDGGVFAFGDAARHGDVTGLGLKVRAVGLAVVPAAAR